MRSLPAKFQVDIERNGDDNGRFLISENIRLSAATATSLMKLLWLKAQRMLPFDKHSIDDGY